MKHLPTFYRKKRDTSLLITVLDVYAFFHAIRYLLYVLYYVAFFATAYLAWVQIIHPYLNPDPYAVITYPSYSRPLIYTLLALVYILIVSGFYAVMSANKNKHGSAKWASLLELRRAHLIMSRHSSNFLPLGTQRLFSIGLNQLRQESHILLVAPTGKRKTSGIIIPGLLTEQGERSLFVNDVKGELIEKCLGALAERYACHVFCPTRPMQSHSYNPLAHVASMEDAEQLAECFVSNTGTSSEPFWDNAARLVITAAIMHLRTTEPRAPLHRLADFLTTTSLEELQRLLLNSPSAIAKRTATNFMQSLSLNTKLGGSVLAELSTRFMWLQNPDVQRVTSANDLDFHALIEHPTALFLSIPSSSSKRLKPLSAALIMQLMNTLAREAEREGGRLARPIAFYLDEFANAGHIPNYLSHISLVRSMGISLIMAIQSFGQLVSIYDEEGKDTILANSTTQIIFPGCGPIETQHYSRVLGEQTVNTVTVSRTILKLSPTLTNSATSRALMNADELRTMPLGRVVVISDNMRPFRVRNKTYLQRPEMNARIGLPAPALTRVKIEPLPPQALPTAGPPPQATPKTQQQTNDPYIMP